MRVRVRLDISKALKKVVYMISKGGKNFMCLTKYGRLPTFFYICGKIGHKTQHCEQFSTEISKKEYQFGVWLRAHINPSPQGTGRWRNDIETFQSDNVERSREDVDPYDKR